MNAVIASESFRYLRPDLNQPGIQIQGNVASWTRKTGGANKRPNFAARGGNKLRQLFRWHATSDYSRGNRLRIREFDFVGHTVVGLTIELSHAGPRTQANPRLPGKPEALPGVGCSDLVSRHGQSSRVP